MSWTHNPEDPPRVCAACVTDAAFAPEGFDFDPSHDPEPIGEDEDGPYCFCGHAIEEVRE